MSKINNPPTNGPVKWGEILQYFLLYIQYRAIPEKTEGCRENTFLEKNPENFNFLTLPLEISDKTKLHLWELNKIVLRPKTKNFGNSTQLVLDHPWKFPVTFN